MRLFRFCLWVLFLPAAGLLAGGCSATKFVPQDRALLTQNNLVVTPERELPPGTLDSYLKQQPNTGVIFGWKTLLHLYSLRSRAGQDNGWNRFIANMGEAPVLYDSTLVAPSLDNLAKQLTALGWYHNRLEATPRIKNRRATVDYKVQLGRTYTIDSISYRICDSALAALFFADTASTLVRPGDRLSPLALDRESERVATRFKNRGYYHFNKNYIAFVADTLAGDGKARLTMQINDYVRGADPSKALPHRKFRLGSITVYPNFNAVAAAMDSQYVDKMRGFPYQGMYLYYTGDRNLRPRFIRSLNLLDTNQVYSEARANATYQRFSSVDLYNGVTLMFDEIPNTATDSTGLLDCSIRLTPGSSQGYKVNMEVSSNSNGLIGVSPALSYYHKNIFKGGEWLSLGFMGNFQFNYNKENPVRSNEFGTSLALSIPKMLFPVTPTRRTAHLSKTEISAGYNYQKRPEYERNMGSFNFGYAWRGGRNRYFTVNPIQLNLVKLSSVDPLFLESIKDPFLIDTYRDHFDLGTSYSYYYTSDPSTQHNRSWYYFRAGLTHAGNVLSLFKGSAARNEAGYYTLGGIAYSQYVKTDLTLVHNRVFTPFHCLASRLSLGLGLPYGNSSSLPLEQQFYSGGANSLRAWQARTVGPGSMPRDSSFTIPNQTGELKLEANLEYRFKLFWKLEGALFVDAGNVWTLPKKGETAAEERALGVFRFRDFYRSVAMDCGFGLRMNLDFVILRLDAAGVMREPVSRTWTAPKRWFTDGLGAIQFGVGYPF